MTSLTLLSDNSLASVRLTSHDGAEIAGLLAKIGVRFERWQANRPLPAGASPDEVLAAYADDVARLKAERGFATADVIRIERGGAGDAIMAMRDKFRSEHTHSEDEARFFVAGSGAFYLHVEDAVYQVVCETGDLISVPAGARHWFDMGPAPEFTAIRFFTSPEGWVARFTGDHIAGRYPDYQGQHAAPVQC